MRASAFDFVGNLDTLLAVVIGAFLATGGALVAEQIEDRVNRKRRERDAARFFGEILASIDTIIDSAVESQKVGDPWGPVSQRLFRTALRETQVYERNRERLFDIRDTSLRARIHTHFIRETFPLESIVDHCRDIGDISTSLENDDLLATRAERLKARVNELNGTRLTALNVLLREGLLTRGLCDELEKIASVHFDTGADNVVIAAPPIDG